MNETPNQTFKELVPKTIWREIFSHRQWTSYIILFLFPSLQYFSKNAALNGIEKYFFQKQKTISCNNLAR